MEMVGSEDLLFRPVLRGMIKGESLLDGTVDLEFIMLMNEALDVDQENQYRAQEAQRRGK